MDLIDFLKWAFGDEIPTRNVAYDLLTLSPFPYEAGVDGRKELLRGMPGRFMATLHEMNFCFEGHMLAGSIVYLELRSDGHKVTEEGRIDCPKLDCHPDCSHKKPLTIARSQEVERHISTLIVEKLQRAMNVGKELR